VSCVQKTIGAITGVSAGVAFLYYSNDTTQLQFDAATSMGSLLALLDPEKAHRFGMWAAKSRLVPRDSRPDPPSLATTVWGRHFVNPLGERALPGKARGTDVLDLGESLAEKGTPPPLPWVSLRPKLHFQLFLCRLKVPHRWQGKQGHCCNSPFVERKTENSHVFAALSNSGFE